MKVELSISRSSVLSLVEGISITIAQHTGANIEALWASNGEWPKLDIYFREAISDLERRLDSYLDESSAKFDLMAAGGDYAPTLRLSDNWNRRLCGLLENKVQDYLVHAVTGGWLNDFPELSIKQDYQTMAGQDISDILHIVGQKEFGFGEAERGSDEDKEGGSATEFANRGDATDEDKEGGSATEFANRGDATDEDKEGGTDLATVGARHEDNTCVHITHDRFDWNYVPHYPPACCSIIIKGDNI